MSKPIKWKRAEAGRYHSTDGRFQIELEDGMWHLLSTDGNRLFGASQKKACQEKAEELKGIKAVKKAPPKRRQEPEEEETLPELPKRRNTVHDPNIESLLASFRLEISHLSDTINLLSATILNLEKELKSQRRTK